MEQGGLVKVVHVLFECPVCFEVPDGNIYQCRSGHVICDTCFKGVELCPQCGEELDDKFRNRALEALIAGMEVDCKYKEEGCEAVMLRRDLANHLEDDCEFGPVKKISLCHISRLRCEFSSRRGDNLYQHLVEKHNVTPYVVSRLEDGIKSKCRYGLKNFFERARTAMMSFNGYGALELPVGEGPPAKFLFCFYVNVQRKYVSVICLYLGQNEAITKELTVTTELCDITKDVRWTWTGKPIHYMNAEKAFINPSFQVQLSNLLEILGDKGKEKLVCDIEFLKS